MTELEKLEYAKSFMDKLANGINPLDDTPIPDDDIANNVRLTRYFFYVSDILRQVIENGGIQQSEKTSKTRERKKAFSLTEEEQAKIEVSDLPLSVSEISKYLNTIVNLSKTKKLSSSTINNWLLSLELLEIVELTNGKRQKLPTEQGKEIGIFTEERSGKFGDYTMVLFSSQAQQFIYDNVDALADFKNKKRDPLADFHGRKWTEIHDSYLTDLFQKNVPISEIAQTLKRTEEGIAARLQKLGLIENNSDEN